MTNMTTQVQKTPLHHRHQATDRTAELVEVFQETLLSSALQHQIKDATRQCFVPDLHDFLLSGWDGVFNSPSAIICVIRRENHCAAIAASLTGDTHTRLKETPYAGQPAIYLAMAMVLSEWRGQGLYREISLARLRTSLLSGCDIVFVRTQNPAVVSVTIGSLHSLVLSGAIEAFSLEYTRLEKNAYGLQVAALQPLSQNSIASELLSGVDASAGDVMLLVWRITHADKPPVSIPAEIS